MKSKVAIRVIQYIFILITSFMLVKSIGVKKEDLTLVAVNLNNVDKIKEVGEECDITCYLSDYDDTLTFLTKTFGVNKKKFVNKLVKINNDDDYLEYNIGRIENSKGKLVEYGSFEEGLIEYLYKYVEENPKLVSNKFVPYTGKPKYVENLIRYFTRVYTNVDYLLAISIGAAESGYYKVEAMLYNNNIYGGMLSKQLIRYKNIEYGVLTFIRTLSREYFGKGLNTIESIGKVYNPKMVDGKKVASPHWVKLVNSTMKHYEGTYNEVTVSYFL